MSQKQFEHCPSKLEKQFVHCFQRLFPTAPVSKSIDFEESCTLSVICNLGSVAFESYKSPEDYGKNLGITELTRDGTAVTHLNKDELKNCMEGVLKITLHNATNVQSQDIGWSRKSDPYVAFSTGISMSTSKVINNADSPSWNSTHYIFLRKHSLVSENSDVLHIDLMDYDTGRNEEDTVSLERMHEKDDLLGSKDIPLEDLKRKGVTKHSLEMAKGRGYFRRSTMLKISTQFLTVNELCEELQKSRDSYWLDKHRLQNTKFPWSRLCWDMRIPPGFIQPVAFFDCDDSGTQAWLHVERDSKTIILAFRGTETEEREDIQADIDLRPGSTEELAEDKFILSPTGLLSQKDVPIHGGFLRAWKSLHETILQAIYSISGWNKDWLIAVTGHSLGGALAVLSAYEIANRTKSGERPEVGMLSVGAPRLARDKFIENYRKSIAASYRVVNDRDIVHFLPHAYEHVDGEVRVQPDGAISFEDFAPSTPPNPQSKKDTKKEQNDGNVHRSGSIREALSAKYHLQAYYFELIDNVVKKFIS